MKPSHLRQYDWIEINELYKKLDYLKRSPNETLQEEFTGTLKAMLKEYFSHYDKPFNPAEPEGKR